MQNIALTYKGDTKSARIMLGKKRNIHLFMTQLLVELFNAIDFVFCDYVPPHEISVRNVSKIFNILKVLHALSKKKSTVVLKFSKPK